MSAQTEEVIMPQAPQRKPTIKKILPLWLGFVLLAPAIVVVGVFLIFPGVLAVFQSLTDRTLTGITAVSPHFVGLRNYQAALSDPAFWNSVKVTLEFVIGSAVIGQAILGFLLAFMLHGRKGVLPNLVSNIVILAWIIPEVVVAYMWVSFLDTDFGLANRVLSAVGVGPVNWFFQLPVLTIILFNTWRGTAFSMLLFGAALQEVPPSYVEAAQVMGASRWQMLRDIIIPSVKNHIATDLILITVWTFNVFGPFLLTGGGPNFRTDLLSIYTYRNAFKYFQLGYGSATSVLLLLINLVFVLFYLRMSKKPARS